MANVAVIILGGTEGHADAGRPVDSLQTATEFAEADVDGVELVFDGARTGWIPELEDEASDYHELYGCVRDDAAACEFCSGAFGVEDAVADAGVTTLDDHDEHPLAGRGRA